MAGATDNTPLVSIGLAVYNGERYLEEAIRSILAQTYTNFELIISDNASTDRTEAICRGYAAQDARIRYSRNATNIGGANNENLTFRLSRGKYFRWAAHDDVCAPELIETCVAVMEAHPEVVLCHSRVVTIDEHGRRIGERILFEGTQPTPFARFRQLSTRSHDCEATYGLMRASVLKQTRMQMNYTDSDRVFLCELALHGPFYQIDAPLFYKRVHPGNVYKDWRGRMAWFLPELQKTGKITLPNWLQFFDFFVTINRAPAAAQVKLLCYLWMFPWLVLYGRRMVKDLLVALMMVLQPKQRRKDKYANVKEWA